MRHRGDTLVEVLFALAILATFVGFSFTGAVSGYKFALASQNRTQAIFVAQHQADGLKTYRDSLDWDGSGGLPSFLGGNIDPVLPKVVDLIPDTSFCMNTATKTNGVKYWKIITDPSTCEATAQSLALNLDSPKISINIVNDPSSVSNPNKKIATVVVSWQPRNTSIREQVTNIVVLTKEE